MLFAVVMQVMFLIHRVFTYETLAHFNFSPLLCISWLLSFPSLQLTSCNAHSMICLHYIHNPLLGIVPLPYYFKENLTRGFPHGQNSELSLSWPRFDSWLGNWDPARYLVWQKKKILPFPEDTASSLITKWNIALFKSLTIRSKSRDVFDTLFCFLIISPLPSI